MRTESSEKEKEEKKETFRYMEQFRETFSRPVDPIRFVGLFDCVNRSVKRSNLSVVPVLSESNTAAYHSSKQRG
jgi:uncharacterized protein (DUF2235 family)